MLYELQHYPSKHCGSEVCSILYTVLLVLVSVRDGKNKTILTVCIYPIGYRKQKDLDKTQKLRHEKDVQSIKCTLESMVNPFEPGREEIVHLTSGLVATQEVKSDLLSAKEAGEKQLQTFIQEKLLVPEPDIFSKLPMLKLKTFTSMAKKVKVTSKNGTEATLKNNRNLFARMLLLAQSININMKDVLSYSLGPFPLSISTEQGSLRKTPKSKLLNWIENFTNSQSVEHIPEGGALILDAMAIVQAISKPPTTFGELAEQILETAIKICVYHKCSRVDFVVDTYPDVSIKDIEHSVRASDRATVVTIYGAEQKVPTQWKKFLKHGPNKLALLHFLFQSWCKYSSSKLCGLTLYVSESDQCHCLSPAATNDACVIVQQIPELACDHEEADTRMLLHASHATRYNNVLVRSPDTDVFVLLLHFSFTIPCKLYFLTGVKDRARILDIAYIAQELGEEKCRALIGLHAFTGKAHIILKVYHVIFYLTFSKKPIRNFCHPTWEVGGKNLLLILVKPTVQCIMKGPGELQ